MSSIGKNRDDNGSFTDPANRVCPVERAGGLDTLLRRLIQNPHRLLKLYLHNGMTVLDMGCGPGFFTIPMAEMVGPTGRVIAADLQQGMLDLVRKKVQTKPLKDRITLHLCQPMDSGIKTKVDFILAFYLVHEVPNQEMFFSEMAATLKPGGQFLIVEPIFHVSRSDFLATIHFAHTSGLIEKHHPRIFMSRSVLLQHHQDQQRSDSTRK